MSVDGIELRTHTAAVPAAVAGNPALLGPFAFLAVAVATTNVGLVDWAGVTTFAFCAVFADILVDGFGQDLGGRPMPMGDAVPR